MTVFNDPISKRLRLSRLKSLRTKMVRLEHVTLEELTLVLEKFDWFMIQNMLDQYEREIERLPSASDLAPVHVAAFWLESQKMVREYGEFLFITLPTLNSPMSKPLRDRLSSKINAQHDAFKVRISAMEATLARFGPDEFCFIRRVCEAEKKATYVPPGWPMSYHDFSLRHKWYYTWNTRHAANRRLSTYQANYFLILWQIESHLGLPKRTYADELQWSPQVIVSPFEKDFKP